MGFGRGSVCHFCDRFWVVAEIESRGEVKEERQKKESQRRGSGVSGALSITLQLPADVGG